MANNEKTIAELAEMMADKDLETARTGKRKLWQRIRNAGQPGKDQQRQAAVDELLKLSGKDQPAPVRREVIWMLSEIGGDECVDAVAAMLADADLREDARMVLQRLPGDKSLEALKAGMTAAPAESKPNIAESLRARGVEVADIPDEKLKPCRETKVTPVGR